MISGIGSRSTSKCQRIILPLVLSVSCLTSAVLLYKGLQLGQDLTQHSLLSHIDLKANPLQRPFMINFIHRFKVLSRWTRERNFNEDALLRLLRFVDDILEVEDVGRAQLTLSCRVVFAH